jgi:hypothetical protein
LRRRVHENAPPRRIFWLRGDFFQAVNAPRAEQKFCALRGKRAAAAAPKPLDAPVMRTHLFFNGDFMVRKNYSVVSRFLFSSSCQNLNPPDNLSNKNPTTSAHRQPTMTAATRSSELFHLPLWWSLGGSNS